MQPMVLRGMKLTLLALVAAASIGAVKPQIGVPAPPLQMTMIDGTKLTLE